MTFEDPLDDMLHVPDEGTYEVEATVTDTPWGPNVVSFEQWFPDAIREEVMSQAEEELENASVGESVTIVVDVDEMTFSIE